MATVTILVSFVIGADVAQPPVQGDQDPSRGGGCRDNVSVRRADQPFFSHCIDIVTGAGQDRGRQDGQVLVELELTMTAAGEQRRPAGGREWRTWPNRPSNGHRLGQPGPMPGAGLRRRGDGVELVMRRRTSRLGQCRLGAAGHAQVTHRPPGLRRSARQSSGSLVPCARVVGLCLPPSARSTLAPRWRLRCSASMG
jgi:hypothetical protein